MSEPTSHLGQTIVIGVVVFVAGLFIGAHIETNTYSAFLGGLKTIRQTDDPYKLVAPLVGIDSPSALLIGRYANLDRSIRSYASQNRNEVDSYALYYRDLNSSQWFGIHEDEKYVPASLLKIALAFVVLKQEASDSQFAKMKKIYTPDIARINTSAPFLEPSELVVGHTTTHKTFWKKCS